MEVIINQQIVLSKRVLNKNEFISIQKSFKSNIIPHVGDMITDSFWKNSYAYTVSEVIIDYQKDSCSVTVELLDCENDKKLYDKQIDIAKKHGWEISL